MGTWRNTLEQMMSEVMKTDVKTDEIYSDPEVISVPDLLKMPLRIPIYQRPYEWSDRNVVSLLSDLSRAEEEQLPVYSLGTVLLYSRDDAAYDIIDGQQRLITLGLLQYDLSGDLGFLQNLSFSDPVSCRNIHDNGQLISAMLRHGSVKLSDLSFAEAVIIRVHDLSSAFQLFDSQNARGKQLEPHDLLKAWHLRQMHLGEAKTKQIVQAFESCDNLHDLFALYLFPIRCWAQGKRCPGYDEHHIDAFKGISPDLHYPYVERIRRAMPDYQITKPFLACRGGLFRFCGIVFLHAFGSEKGSG